MKRTEVRIDGYTGQELDGRFQRIEQALENLVPAPRPPRWIKKLEASVMLGVTTKTLHNWNKAGILISYSLGNRMYYRSDPL